MGASLLLPNGHAEQVLDGPEIGNGQWYRIGEYQPVDDRQNQVAAQFVLSDGNESRNDFIRLRAAVAYNHESNSLLLEEYACWEQPALARARLVTVNSGAALEVWGDNPATATMRLRVRHEDFWPGTRWTPVNFTPVPVATSQTPIMQRGIAPTGQFLAPDLVNSWADYGGGYAAAGYRMSPGSAVELRGLVKGGTVSYAATVFTLPVGYRPKERLLFATTAGGDAHGRVDVTSDGAVIAAAGPNSWFSLNGIRFLAEQ